MSATLLLLAGAGAAALAASGDDAAPTADAARAAVARSTALPTLVGQIMPSAPVKASSAGSAALPSTRAGMVGGRAVTGAATTSKAASKAASVTVRRGAAVASVYLAGGSRGAGAPNAADQVAATAKAKIEAELIKGIDSLEGSAKCAAIKVANEKYNLTLDCDSTTGQQVMTAIIGVAGTAAGSAVCGPPCGAAGAYLAALAAAKIAPWCEAQYEAAKDWIGDAAEDAYDYVAGGVSDAYDAASDWVGGLF